MANATVRQNGKLTRRSEKRAARSGPEVSLGQAERPFLVGGVQGIAGESPFGEGPASPASLAPLRVGIDRVSDREISGWACREDDLKQRPRAKLYLDGALISTAGCADFRQDLLDAGIGDGKYAFVLKLPPTKMRTASRIQLAIGVGLEEKIVFEKENAIEEGLSEGELRTVYFDVTDLLIWSMHHPQVSGIQRVQCGFIDSLMLGEEMNVRFCAQQPASRRYVVVPPEHLYETIAVLNARSSVRYEFIKARSRELMEDGNPEFVHFLRNDTLCVMGASWMFPGYFQEIQRQKRDTGIRCAHLFYDAIPTVVPETCDATLVEMFNRALAGMFLCADIVYAISEYSAAEFRRIAERVGVAAPPVQLVPMGSSIGPPSLKGRPGVRRRSNAAEKEFGLDNYVLCVGTIEPRKNHVYLFHVWRRLFEELGERAPKLVCVGRFGWHTDELRRHLSATDGLEGHFVVLEQVTDEQLTDLYEGCLFTVFPSLYEGWGLPVSESLAHGKVCVTSRLTSLPEAGKDWALYIDPYNVEDGLQTIRELILNPAKVRQIEAVITDGYVPISWEQASADFKQSILGFVADRDAAQGESRMPLLGEVYSLVKNRGARTFDIISEEIKRLTFCSMLAGSDWYEMEDWGVWSAGPHFRIAVTVPPSDDTIMCYLRVTVPHYLELRQCSVFLDGSRVPGCEVSHMGKNIRVRIPSRSNEAGGDKPMLHRISVDLDKVLNPEAAQTKETRLLGLGLKSVFLCKESDFRARLQYIEEFVIT